MFCTAHAHAARITNNSNELHLATQHMQHLCSCIFCIHVRYFFPSLMLSVHVHESYCSQFVCPHSSTSLGRVCNELNLPARSLLHSEGFFLFSIAKRSAILHLVVDVGAVLSARCNAHALI